MNREHTIVIDWFRYSSRFYKEVYRALQVLRTKEPPPAENLPHLEMSGRQLVENLVAFEKEAMDKRRMMFTAEPMIAFTVGDGSVVRYFILYFIYSGNNGIKEMICYRVFTD